MMQRHWHTLAVLWVSTVIFFLGEKSVAQLQQKPNPPEVGVSLDSLSRENEQNPLPKIYVPEYVILGSAAIEIAPSEKNDLLSENIASVTHLALQNTEKASPSVVSVNASAAREGNVSPPNGFFDFQGGTYATYNVIARHAEQFAGINFSAGGRYAITHGFVPYTNRSGGGIDVAANSRFSIDKLFTDGAVRAGLTYSTEKFYWYGSLFPSRERIASFFRVMTEFSNFTELPEANFSLNFTSFLLTDAGNMRSDNSATFYSRIPVHLSSLRLTTEATIAIASRDVAGISVTARSERYEWNTVHFEGALEFSWMKGMAGQTILRLSPQLEMGSEIISRHYFYVSYVPTVRFNSLYTLYRTCPYLTANSIIRHENVTDAGIIGIKSTWSKSVRTKVSFQLESIRDYSLLTEYQQGEWQTVFRGKITYPSFLGEMVAKFTVNDYFSTQVRLNSARVESTSERVPYLPIIEGNALWQHEFSHNARTILLLRYVGQRESDIMNSTVLPAYAILSVRGEYEIVPQLRLLLEAQNITDRRYFYWNRYREVPLTVLVGVRIQW